MHPCPDRSSINNQNDSSSNNNSSSSSNSSLSSSDVISSGDVKSSEPSSSSSHSASSSNNSSSSLPQEVYYHVTFLNYDETKLYEVDVLEGHEAVYSGETPTKAEDEEFTYEFDGWDKDLTNIQADVTTVATYKYVAKENWGPITWF